MKSINRYIKSHYLPDKSVKSLWKLLIGARTQQTYFDAVMQDLLPVYELYPNVSFEAVTRLVRNDSEENISINNNLKLYPYFYYASELSFSSFVLLLQTVSEYLYHSSDYLPSSNRLFIQQHVKQLFTKIKKEDQFIHLAQEVDDLSQYIFKSTGSCYFIHFLHGHQIRPDSYEQLSKQFNISIDEIKSQMITEKNLMLHAFKTREYKLLSYLYVRTPLHINTSDTYQRLINGDSIDMIQRNKSVRIHTIQDHIIEILIKDYPLDISNYLSEQEYITIKEIIENNRYGKLKTLYEISPIKDYFKLKIAIVKYKMEQCK